MHHEEELLSDVPFIQLNANQQADLVARTFRQRIRTA
jgi:hypothetical protein